MAPETEDMMMLVQLAVKPFLPAAGFHLPDQPVCGKCIQITVHGRQTDSRQDSPNAFIQFISSWVGQVVPQLTQNNISLMGHAQISSHVHLVK